LQTDEIPGIRGKEAIQWETSLAFAMLMCRAQKGAKLLIAPTIPSIEDDAVPVDQRTVVIRS
jgi:hypothetical protein